jgi:type IV secretion system protein VirB11
MEQPTPSAEADLHSIVGWKKDDLSGATFCPSDGLAGPNEVTYGYANAARRLGVVILEDTIELQCEVANLVQLRTSMYADITKLLRTSMRLRPDRIIVGEVRGAEALALLKAWNTGHPGGISTIHANNCLAGLIRLEQLIHEANVPPQPALIAETINIVVWISRTRMGRRVEQIKRVCGWTAHGGYELDEMNNLECKK